jgi:hypothetical protein
MTMEGLPTEIAILSNDYGMSAPLAPSSVTIVSEPHNGAVLVDALTGQAWYFPDSDFYGIDDFTYVVSNIFGQVSNVATVTVYVMPDMQPPVIQNFTGSRAGGNLWTFTGTVVDDDPGAITVTFGGVASGTTTTQPDGSFSYTIAIPPGSSGYATAQALNDEGIQSAVVNTIVFNR